jgi:hypothetical protein
VSTTACTITYTYAATAAMASDARARAIANVNGRRIVVGGGTIRHHKLKLTVRHLRAGHYRLTLVELRPHHEPVVIGDSTITVT